MEAFELDLRKRLRHLEAAVPMAEAPALGRPTTIGRTGASRALGSRVRPAAHVGRTGGLGTRVGTTAAAFSAVTAGILVVLGAILVIGGPSDPPSDLVAPAAASHASSRATAAPEVVVLDDGTVVDPELAAAIEQLVGEHRDPACADADDQPDRAQAHRDAS